MILKVILTEKEHIIFYIEIMKTLINKNIIIYKMKIFEDKSVLKKLL